MKEFFRKYRIEILIIVIGVLFFFPFLGEVHLFDWDEINFAEAAREMMVTGDYLTVRIDFKPFHEKPPLFIWFQVLSMKVFGVNEFAARFPNAVLGIITLLFLYTIGKKHYRDEKFGILWVLAYLGSFLPHFYFKTGIIDPAFNLFMFSSVYFWFRYFADKQIKYIYIAAALDGMAILTKGPVGFLLVFMAVAVFWFSENRKIKIPFKALIIFTSLAFIPIVTWYAAVLINTDPALMDEFIDYHLRLLTTGDAGHKGFFLYHFVVLLLGCFPASILMFRGIVRQPDDSESQHLFKNMNLFLLAVVLVIFTIVKTKIVHYSSLAYFPVTFLAARAMYGILFREIRWKISTNILVLIFGLIYALLFTLLPLALMNADMLLPKISDEFTKALLRANAGWQGYEYLIGLLFFIVIVLTLVYMFKHNYLKSFLVLFGGTALTIFIFLPWIAPKIERYTQGATIEFYEQIQDEEAYVYALGFKSYAQYFYTRKSIDESAYALGMPYGEFRDWLMNEPVDKPAYFVAKNNKAGRYLEHPFLEEIYRKNGFVFIKRINPEAFLAE